MHFPNPLMYDESSKMIGLLDVVIWLEDWGIVLSFHFTWGVLSFHSYTRRLFCFRFSFFVRNSDWQLTQAYCISQRNFYICITTLSGWCSLVVVCIKSTEDEGCVMSQHNKSSINCKVFHFESHQTTKPTDSVVKRSLSQVVMVRQYCWLHMERKDYGIAALENNLK